MYNIFTKGANEVVSPQGGIKSVSQYDTQAGFTTEIAVYLAFARDGGDVGGRGVNSTASDHDTPENVSILPLPGCTTVSKSATFTLASSCIPAITSLPSTGPDAAQQNKPSGPDTCHEICDIWRLLTGTCCGRGGSVGNPVYIPPSVTLPYDIILPSGYTPPADITIPLPGQYDPEVVYGSKTAMTTPLSTTTGGGDQSTITTSGENQSTGTTASNDQSSTTYPAGIATGIPGDPDCSGLVCGCLPAGLPIRVFPGGTPLSAALTIPGGTCFPGSDNNDDNGGGGGGGGGNSRPDPPSPCAGCPPGGIVLPGGFSLGGSDPPCYGNHCRPCQAGVCPDGTSDGEEDSNDSDDSDECESDLSTDTGMCPNGNFPL
jgi:hypothetical protein